MLNGLFFDQRNNTAENWREIISNVYAEEDGILNGCAVSFTSNTVTVSDGLFLLAGAAIKNDGSDTITVSPTLTTGYMQLILRIDLSSGSQQSGQGPVQWAVNYSTTSAFPELTQENINDGGILYEQQIAVFQISGGNITSLVSALGTISGVVNFVF